MAMHEALGVAFPHLHEFTPPIRLSRLAPLRNVVDISRKPLNCDGIISANPAGSYLIQVNRDHPESRRRFTIAHEIGHTFFFDVDQSIRQRVRDSKLDRVDRSNGEETLCNYAGAEILMPHRQFGSLIRDSGPGSEVLIRLARTFNVSVQAVSRRTVQLLPYKLIVIFWEYDPSEDGYLSKWTTGLMNGPAAARLAVRRSDPAFSFFHAQDSYRGRVWISLDGPLDDYFVDAVAWWNGHQRRILTVFALERNPAALFVNRRLPLNRQSQMSLF
jgi:hypothetical protein